MNALARTVLLYMTSASDQLREPHHFNQIHIRVWWSLTWDSAADMLTSVTPFTNPYALVMFEQLLPISRCVTAVPSDFRRATGGKLYYSMPMGRQPH